MNLTTFQYEIGELHYSSSCELLFLGFGIAHLILSSIASKIHDTTSLDNILFSQQQLTKHLPDCVQEIISTHNILLVTPTWLQNKHNNNLTNPHIMHQYTNGLDRDINFALRNKKQDNDTIRNYIATMTQTIDHCPLVTPVLYRGVSRYLEPKVGSVYSDLGFMSKSTNFEIAQLYAGMLPSYQPTHLTQLIQSTHLTSLSNGIIFLITYSTPTRHCDISSVSAYSEESELLTYPGEQCLITNKYKVYRQGHLIEIYHCNVQ